MVRVGFEPLLGTLHVSIDDSISRIAEASAPAAPVVRAKKRVKAPGSLRWRPLAIAAALGGIAFAILRVTQPAAHAAEQQPANSAWSHVKQDIADRAAINMVDDFRS
ncbi:MAG TPA: hypothetical protein VFA04_07400, partial [Bryobacteraceae bacterium]|nr:hypothetical protein [Bryobacteraceae bacterium]